MKNIVIVQILLNKQNLFCVILITFKLEMELSFGNSDRSLSQKLRNDYSAVLRKKMLKVQDFNVKSKCFMSEHACWM
jgi:hypothetical protein